jgi:hypothetical protein
VIALGERGQPRRWSVLVHAEIADQHGDGHRVRAVIRIALSVASRGDLLENAIQLVADGRRSGGREPSVADAEKRLNAIGLRIAAATGR